MSNKVLLKKSSVVGKAPATTDLDYGELALNYADGLLYFKNANNIIQSFAAYNSATVTLTATQTLTNKTLTSPTLTTPSINQGTVTLDQGILILPTSTSASQTDVASAVYDSSIGTLTIGTGSGRKSLVEVSASQTLTNKTLSSAVLTGTLNAGASVGTNGQYLKTTGTGVAWATFPTATSSVPGLATAGTGLTATAGAFSIDSTVATLTGTQTLTNKTLTSPTVNGAITLDTIRFKNSNIQKFSQVYNGGATGQSSGYLDVGEYQPYLTITPTGNSDNYAVVGKILVQSGGSFQAINIRAALRSNTLPSLSWAVSYDEELSGTGGYQLVAPVIWVNQTGTGTPQFILALNALATIYGTVTVDVDCSSRYQGTSYYNAEVFNTVNPSEITTIPDNFTSYPFTKNFTADSGTVNYGSTLKVNGVLVDTVSSTSTLTNKTLTSPVISTIVNSGTLTLPTSTDTLVGRATTDTLTNKTLSAATLTGTLTAGGSAGTNGYVLTSTGTGVQWAAAASSYSLPAATTTTLGGVIIPAVATSGITNTSGTIGLATATATQLGGVKIDGTTIGISTGIISVNQSGLTAPAGALTGTTLASNVVTSSLTSVGTLANLTVTNPITGSVTGNAGTVTNGVYTTVSYADPAWITSLAGSKITGLATSATTDTTNASNITSGTLAAARLPTATTGALGAVKIDGTSITITNGVISAVAAVGAAAAGQLTGTTLAANVVTSSLTSVGTLTNLTVTNPITGSVTGSAGSVTAANIVGTIQSSSLPKATTAALGAVRVDGTSITIDSNGIISSTGGSGGTGSGTVNTGTAGNLAYYASSTTAVSPLTALNWTSGTTTLALTGTFSATTLSGSLAASNLTGTIASARLPTATTSAFGAVKVDGTTITINGSGVISASGSGTGTVTSVSTGTGLTGGPITTTGTISIDNTVVTTLNDSQTLTNKTLNSPTITGTITAGGGVGTSGQVLTSTGTGVQWSAVSGGGNYTLPKASTSVLGGVKVDGTTITIAADGTITSTASSGGGSAGGVVPFDCGYLSEITYTTYDFGSIV